MCARLREHLVPVRDEQLKYLIESIDDPNNAVVARMMWEGIAIDGDEARRQKAEYLVSIQACRNLIWKTLGIHSALDTKREVLKVVNRMNLAYELGYDPFLVPFWSDDDPELTVT